ncbi:20874_t:CDS:1 [Dentiscutata erythropus]|uniref:20874_t:CDS:1 n=1 Tax=Dentiscutata erythropus TaxID=1348616 RepID=A0A9N8ZEA1_9GLOM|nr:20874_t:CDS:1 [Dentiscutata erythropus]
MNYTNNRIYMISECRIKAIIRLRNFSKLQGAQYFKALCDIVINDTLLETREKIYLIGDLSLIRDTQNIINHNEEERRNCEYCNKQAIAALYCEFCIRNYLKKQFNEWKTEDKEIDELIRECQLNTVSPSHVIEYIPYEKFKNVKFVTSTENSNIYTATWENGPFIDWDSERQELTRSGQGIYILKVLENSGKYRSEVMWDS